MRYLIVLLITIVISGYGCGDNHGEQQALSIESDLARLDSIKSREHFIKEVLDKYKSSEKLFGSFWSYMSRQEYDVICSIDSLSEYEEEHNSCDPFLFYLPVGITWTYNAGDVFGTDLLITAIPWFSRDSLVGMYLRFPSYSLRKEPNEIVAKRKSKAAPHLLLSYLVKKYGSNFTINTTKGEEMGTQTVTYGTVIKWDLSNKIILLVISNYAKHPRLQYIEPNQVALAYSEDIAFSGIAISHVSLEYLDKETSLYRNQIKKKEVEEEKRKKKRAMNKL